MQNLIYFLAFLLVGLGLFYLDDKKENLFKSERIKTAIPVALDFYRVLCWLGILAVVGIIVSILTK